MELLEFARGPALTFAIVVFIAGVAFRITSLFLMWRTRDTSTDPGPGIESGMLKTLLLLFLLGTSAGMFSVPLEAYMQYRSPPRERGSVLAASQRDARKFLGSVMPASAAPDDKWSTPMAL